MNILNNSTIDTVIDFANVKFGMELTKEQIEITIVNTSKIESIDFNNLAFGQVFSDHMLTCDYIDGKWQMATRVGLWECTGFARQFSREVTELIDAGVELNSFAPEYYYTKLAQLKIKMIESATKDAKNRAERSMLGAVGN